MGTNFYFIYNKCLCCGRHDQLHIGKSSVGWAFALRIYPEDGITSLDDWVDFWWDNEGTIVDESGIVHDRADMFDAIAFRRGDLRYPSIDGKHVIGYGIEGDCTYALCVGEFC